MFIDSPNFPKRKVVHNQGQMLGNFGYERMQLANYVTDELNNNHKNDAAILQKFRKQAQQYKRNLLLQKRGAIMETNSQPNIKYEQAYSNGQQNLQNFPVMVSPALKRKQVEDVQAQNRGQHQQYSAYNERKQQISPIVVRQFIQPPNDANKYLARILQRKDKQLQKQAKIIKRNQSKLKDLKKRIQILQYQNKLKQADRMATFQNQSYEKLKGFITSMNQQLSQNQSLIEQNWSSIQQLKKNSLKSQKALSLPQNQNQTQTQNYNKNSTSLRTQRRRKPFIPEYQQPQQNPQPKISYNNYQVIHQNSIRGEGNKVNSLLLNLSSSRNRLDALGSFV